MRPLYQLLQKERIWHWTPECDLALKQLKEALMSAPVLAYPENGKPLYLQIGKTHTGISEVLLQGKGNGRPIAYESKSLSPVEQRFNPCE